MSIFYEFKKTLVDYKTTTIHVLNKKYKDNPSNSDEFAREFFDVVLREFMRALLSSFDDDIPEEENDTLLESVIELIELYDNKSLVEEYLVRAESVIEELIHMMNRIEDTQTIVVDPTIELFRSELDCDVISVYDVIHVFHTLIEKAKSINLTNEGILLISDLVRSSLEEESIEFKEIMEYCESKGFNTISENLFYSKGKFFLA